MYIQFDFLQNLTIQTQISKLIINQHKHHYTQTESTKKHQNNFLPVTLPPISQPACIPRPQTKPWNNSNVQHTHLNQARSTTKLSYFLFPKSSSASTWPPFYAFTRPLEKKKVRHVLEITQRYPKKKKSSSEHVSVRCWCVWWVKGAGFHIVVVVVSSHVDVWCGAVWCSIEVWVWHVGEIDTDTDRERKVAREAAHAWKPMLGFPPLPRLLLLLLPRPCAIVVVDEPFDGDVQGWICACACVRGQGVIVVRRISRKRTTKKRNNASAWPSRYI